jgi:hypothetical protein
LKATYNDAQENAGHAEEEKGEKAAGCLGLSRETVAFASWLADVSCLKTLRSIPQQHFAVAAG